MDGVQVMGPEGNFNGLDRIDGSFYYDSQELKSHKGHHYEKIRGNTKIVGIPVCCDQREITENDPVSITTNGFPITPGTSGGLWGEWIPDNDSGVSESTFTQLGVICENMINKGVELSLVFDWDRCLSKFEGAPVRPANGEHDFKFIKGRYIGVHEYISREDKSNMTIDDFARYHFNGKSVNINERTIKITDATADFIPGEQISQTVTNGTAKGTVVSWTLDSDSTKAGVLEYIQNNDAHVDKDVVRVFVGNGSNAISGVKSNAEGNVNNTTEERFYVMRDFFTRLNPNVKVRVMSNSFSENTLQGSGPKIIYELMQTLNAFKDSSGNNTPLNDKARELHLVGAGSKYSGDRRTKVTAIEMLLNTDRL